MAGNRSRTFALVIFGALGLIQFFFFDSQIHSGALTNPIAVHWGISGEPDAFGDPGEFLWTVSAIYAVLLVLMGLAGLWVSRTLLRPFLFGLFAFVYLLLMLVFSIPLLAQIGTGPTEVSLSPWLFVGLLLLPVALVIFALGSPRVVLNERLGISLWKFRLLSLEFEQIIAVSEIDLRARDYGGLGIRYSKKTLAFLPSPGRGLLIETNFGERIAIRSNQPEQLVSAITARIGK